MAPNGRLAYASFPPLTLLGIFGCIALGSIALACTAGVKPTGSGTAGTTGSGNTAGSGSGSGLAGNSGTGGLPVYTGMAGTVGQGGTGNTGPACQQKEVKFEAKTPTVYLLVDRSTSMYPCLGSSDMKSICANHANTSWDRLRLSLLQVVDELEDKVRFGFYTFTGTPNMCPTLTTVPPNLNNHQAISTLYNGLPWPTSNDKWETPTARALEKVGADLKADTAVMGDKYIMLVTDGAPDNCDDPDDTCPPDVVVGKLQALKTAGISTIVLGLQSSVNTLSPGTLQAFANAGAGEDTKAPLPTGNFDINVFWDRCNNYAHWRTDLAAKVPTCGTGADFNACRGQSIGTYAATMGPARAYVPTAGDQAQLVTQLSAALAGVKSCTFDLSEFKVALSLLNRATVKIQGEVVPLDTTSTNGWNMVNETQLQLFGTACDDWRDPTATDIKFDFPCEIIID